MNRGSFALLLSLGACMHGGPPRDLGDVADDRVPIAEAPVLDHLPAALEPGGAETVADLFDLGIAFRDAPDPSELLTATRAAARERRNDGIELSVLSYNVGLLDANVFWVVPYAESPYLDERRPVLPDLVLEADYDVLLLQEVWRRRDVRAFEEAAERHGYLAYSSPRGRSKNGLLILVRDGLLAPGAELQTGVETFDERDGMEFFPGPGIRRGVIWAVIPHHSLGPVAVFDTHMQSWPDNWLIRNSEARQAGRLVRRVVADLGDDAIAILGGDLNGGPYYPEDTWPLPDGSVHPGWFANTLSYVLLQHYGGLEDLYVMGLPEDEVLDDVVVGRTIPRRPERTLVEPMGDAAWCEQTRGEVFTATDCNLMYFEQYAGTEYPARMDHLLVSDPAGRVWVESSDLVFTERVPFGELPPMEPSDHLGVEVRLRVRPME